jgi:hypothetical protein
MAVAPRGGGMLKLTPLRWVSHAVAKASVMRLLGIPRLPLPQLVLSSVPAWKCTGTADSLSHSVPLTYVSYLGFFPLSYAPSL